MNQFVEIPTPIAERLRPAGDAYTKGFRDLAIKDGIRLFDMKVADGTLRCSVQSVVIGMAMSCVSIGVMPQHEGNPERLPTDAEVALGLELVTTRFPDFPRLIENEMPRKLGLILRFFVPAK